MGAGTGSFWRQREGRASTILNLGYTLDRVGESEGKKVTLVVRGPKDLRQERVKFRLTNVDLY